jgi:hypothetical protein
MQSVLPNSVITLLVQIGLHVRNSHQLIHLDGLGAHRASFARLHNPVAIQEMVTESNVLKTKMYVRPVFHPRSCMGRSHKHTYC